MPSKTSISILEIFEESAYLFRKMSLNSLLFWLIANLPFLITFFVFISDHLNSFYLNSELFFQSILLSFTYWWMTIINIFYIRSLYHDFYQVPLNPLNFKEIIWVSLKTLQSHSLLFPILAVSIFFPPAFILFYSFFQNHTITLALRSEKKPEYSWEKTFFQLSSIVFGTIIIFTLGFFIYLNILLLKITINFISTSLLNQTSSTSITQYLNINHSFLSWFIDILFTFLIIGAFSKCFFLVRYLKIKHLEDGTHLLMSVRYHLKKITTVFLILSLSSTLFGEQTSNIQTSPNINPQEFSAAIQTIKQQKVYSWQFYNPKNPSHLINENHFLIQFIQDLDAQLGKGFDYFINHIRDFFSSWNQNKFKQTQSSKIETPDDSKPLSPQYYLYFFLTLSLLISLFLLYKIFYNKTTKLNFNSTSPITSINLEDHTINAAQLTPSEWTSLAVYHQQNPRLVIRALYLAMLSTLGQKNILQLTSFTTNGKYRLEFERKNRSNRTLNYPAFSISLTLYEKVWYGNTNADNTVIDQFTNYQQQVIRDL
jgi:hypothetical protein